MSDPRDTLLDALRAPERLPDLAPARWDLLLRQARHADMVAHLAERLAARGLLDRLPEAPRRHLVAAQNISAKQHRDVRWEARCLTRVLGSLEVPLILLKGAAYVMGDLPAARGRIFRDIDLMVPRERLDEVEQKLLTNGWLTMKKDDYDQHYYRTWTHQLPPMIHHRRMVSLDVHHTIVPLTARPKVDAQALRDASQPLEANGDLRVLAPPDMVLHSATHLFNEGEFSHGLRDLADLDALLRDFGSDPAFWPQLLARAELLDLRRPLFYSLRYLSSHLATPIPAEVMELARPWGPGETAAKAMDRLFVPALRPIHETCDNRWSGIARWLLYVRAHHLRMPAHILVPHLVRKAVTRRYAMWKGQPRPA
ncbi:MAG: nucleotidyltransferase family protein [Pseudomonadota bacterium]